MIDVVVIAPVLGRPDNAGPLASSLAASTDRARLVFVCSPDDDAEIASCHATGAETIVVDWWPGWAEWARKLEFVRACTDEPYMLLGADDIRFRTGWVEAVLDVFAHNDVGVVGTNDLANPAVRAGRHSTHPVVCRGYADMGTIDNPGLMLHDGYFHQFVDNELVETARHRGCWAFARKAHVEHLHPVWSTATNDDTYRRGAERARDDQRLFNQRRRLWR